MTRPGTLLELRRRSARLACALLAAAVFALGAREPRAWGVVGTLIFALAAWWAARRSAHPYPLVRTWLYVPVAAVAAIGAAQFFAGLTADAYSTALQAARWTAYAAFFVVLVDALADFDVRREFAHGLVWLGAAAAVVGAVQNRLSPREIYGSIAIPGGSPFGPFPEAETFAALALLIFPLTLWLAARRTRFQVFYYPAAALLAGAVILSGSRRGVDWLEIELAAAALAWPVLGVWRLRRGSRSRGRSNPALTALGLGLVAAVLLAPRYSETVQRRFPPEPAAAEIGLLAASDDAWKMVRARPLLGSGLGAFQAAFPPFRSVEDGLNWRSLENDPLQIAAEAGLIGAAGLALMVPLAVFGRPSEATVLGIALPLLCAGGFALEASPFQTPAIMLTALALLAAAPNPAPRRPRP